MCVRTNELKCIPYVLQFLVSFFSNSSKIYYELSYNDDDAMRIMRNKSPSATIVDTKQIRSLFFDNPSSIQLQSIVHPSYSSSNYNATVSSRFRLSAGVSFRSSLDTSATESESESESTE